MKTQKIIVIIFSFFNLCSCVFASTIQDWALFEPGKNAGVFADTGGSKVTISSAEGPAAGGKALKISANIVAWGGMWAIAKTDLSNAYSIEFQARSNSPVALQVGVMDSSSVQYVSVVRINAVSWKKYSLPLSLFSKTIYPDPKAPKNTPLTLSSIESIQFQPVQQGNFNIYIGPVSQNNEGPPGQKKAVGTDKTGYPVLSPLKVRGNRIVDSSGKTVILKGLCLGDPAQLRQYGLWTEEYIKQAALWGAKLIRIPMSPQAYRSVGNEELLSILNQGVDWCEKYGMYAIIDWHPIGNPVSGIFLDPEESFRTTKDETKEFWAAAAEMFRDRPAAAFYEVFNEPASIYWRGGKLSWEEWRNWADEIVDVIYAGNPRAIPVVGGLDFAFDLKGADTYPLANKGVVLAAHPYPGHAPQPWEENWEDKFGFMAKEYPMILTEFGFDPDDKVLPNTYKADVSYGRRILDFAKERGMSWTAFVFADLPGWPMPLYKGSNYTPTVSGRFFKDELAEKD